MNYWQKRLNKQQEELYDSTLAEFNKHLSLAYKNSLIKTRLELIKIYDKMAKDSEDGKIRVNDLYREERHLKMINFFNKELSNISKMQEAEIAETLSKMYYNQSLNVSKQLNTVFDKEAMEVQVALQKAINSVWCADGKTWSDRIWQNKDKILEKMQKDLVDTVARGVSKDELVKSLIKDFNVQFYQADRIVRTELTYVQNQASTDRYKEAGVEYYEFLAEIDDRTSEECTSLNGLRFKMEEAEVGVNMPPMHSNCRSTTIPVFDK